VTSNWSDSKDLSADTCHTEKSVPLLTGRSTRAFLKHAPLRPNRTDESERVHRKLSFGPLLEIFMLDWRSYRGPNTSNVQPTESPESGFWVTCRSTGWCKISRLRVDLEGDFGTYAAQPGDRRRQERLGPRPLRRPGQYQRRSTRA